MIKKIYFALIAFFISNTALGACSPEKIGEFYKTWNNFYSTAQENDPAKVSRFFNFPLKLRSPFDGEKPIVINRRTFLKNYPTIFLQFSPNQDNEIYAEFKKFKTLSESEFRHRVNLSSCERNPQSGAIIHVGSYHFVWHPNKGWLIDAVDYGGSQADNLKFQIQHGLLEK